MSPSSSNAPHRQSSVLSIAMAWIIVGLPAAWGVEQTLVKSLSLFQQQAPVRVTAPSMTK